MIEKSVILMVNLYYIKFIIEKNVKSKPFVWFDIVNVKLCDFVFYGFSLLGISYYVEIKRIRK